MEILTVFRERFWNITGRREIPIRTYNRYSDATDTKIALKALEEGAVQRSDWGQRGPGSIMVCNLQILKRCNGEKSIGMDRDSRNKIGLPEKTFSLKKEE